jgi:dephospho-CoA kinase
MAQPAPAHRGVPRIALTGGVASGKSTVAQLFSALGAALIDTDQVARDVVAPGTPALARIVDGFGPGVLTAAGTLDRAQLRRTVFADATARQTLEAITHPVIRAEVARRAATVTAPYLLIAVPLLAETGTDGDYDRVLVVDCPAAAQRTRLMVRDGMTLDAAERMLAAQASREQRLAIADDVIENTGDVALLAPQVAALHQRYLALRSP